MVLAHQWLGMLCSKLPNAWQYATQHEVAVRRLHGKLAARAAMASGTSVSRPRCRKDCPSDPLAEVGACAMAAEGYVSRFHGETFSLQIELPGP